MGYGDNRGKNRGHRNESGGGGRDGRNRRGGGGGYGGYRPSFGGGNRFPPADAPVQVGKEYLVTIGELSRRGEGVAKISGFVIFVPGAKADAEKKIKIRIDRVGPRFASGTIVEGGVDESSEESSESSESTDDESQGSDNSDSMVEQV
ncbi:MAG: TRAM domain-containing protein [Thaumarchaeota archaeon]|nr:TRAM domain-containing protein [Nitrososphaerota archaeon]